MKIVFEIDTWRCPCGCRENEQELRVFVDGVKVKELRGFIELEIDEILKEWRDINDKI